MFKVLLLDDEKYIRFGLHSIIESSNTCFTGIFECNNAVSAISMVKEYDIDLVILDIEMPGMDGIGFMQKIYNEGLKVKFIVLSGYDKFSYASESMKYGAMAYLLKPVNRTELIEMVRKAESEIIDERQADLSKEKAKQVLSSVYDNEMNYILLNNKITEDEIMQITHMLNLDLLEDEYQILALAKKSVISGNHYNYSTLSMRCLVNDFFSGQKSRVSTFIDSENNLIIIINTYADIKGLYDYLLNNAMIDCSIGVSRSHSGSGGIKKAYKEAVNALKYRIFPHYGSIINFDSIASLSENKCDYSSEIKKLAQLVGTGKASELLEIINSLFNMNRLRSINIKSIEELVTDVIECINHPAGINRDASDGLPASGVPVLIGFSEFDTIDGFISHLKNHVLTLDSLMRSYFTDNRINCDMSAALRFINENYDKDINMAVAANTISMNYTHFSYLFKKFTGSYFVDYLKNLRIDKAMELLKSSQYSISEISELVGYKNSKHFANLFKATAGISPTDYRRRYKRN